MDGINELIDQKFQQLKRELLDGLNDQSKSQTSERRTENSQDLEILTDALKVDPRKVNKWRKKACKVFEDPTPTHYLTKDNTSTALIKDLIEDIERVEGPLQEVIGRLRASDSRESLEAIQRLLITTKTRAKYKLWNNVAAHVAPHVPKQGHLRELLCHWPNGDLNGFTATLQEMEGAQLQSTAMRRMVDIQSSFSQRREPPSKRDRRDSSFQKDPSNKETREKSADEKKKAGHAKRDQLAGGVP
jgi:hypothetical protein